MIATHLVIFFFNLTPPGPSTYAPAATNRLIAVQREARFIAIPRESRFVKIPA